MVLPLRALIYWPHARETAKKILVEGLSGLLDIVWAADSDEAMGFIRGADIYVGPIANWVFERGERLRFVQGIYAGIDNVDLDLARSRGIMVATAKGVNSFYVAEMALALMLSLAKRITMFDRMAKEGGFPPYSWEYSVDTLRGKTVVILGYGGIGRELARLLKPFGARIIGIKRSPGGSRDEYVDIIAGQEDLERYLGEADFLVISMPLTRETRGLVNAKILSRIKRGCYVINVGRGPIVDEDSLYMALREGGIAGAGIDVWWLYPHRDRGKAFSSKGIHLMDNVVATPHRAGFCEQAELDVARFVVVNVKRYLSGEVPEGLVDFEKGY